MNQTEILKQRSGTQNKCIQNIQNSCSYSNQNSSITIIKTNTYEQNRDKTPKLQIVNKSNNNSSNKLIRVNSSKGINVSLRPTSSEKQVKQFNCMANNSITGSSQTTIKLDDTHIMHQMRQQLKKTVQKYEDKMNKQLSYQHNHLTVQIDRLKSLLIQSQNKIIKQELQLVQLINRVQTVQRKIQTKTNLMGKQLAQFKRFYDQCYNYTINRISQAQTNMKILAKYIDQATSQSQNIQSWKYIQYSNMLVKRIVTNCSHHTSQLKYYLNEQLYNLQLQVSQFNEKYEQLDTIVHDMKNIKYGNQSLKQYIKQLGKFGITTNNIRKDYHKQNFLSYYQPKFQEIIKRVNNSAIQIDLIKSMLTNQSQSQSKKYLNYQHKIEQLNKTIQNLQLKIYENTIRYKKQLQIKQQTLSRCNPRILQLQTKLHACYEHQAILMKQVSDLKLKVTYYQTKCQKNSDRQYGIQSTLAQAYAQTLVKQKTKKYQQQKQILNNKIKQLEYKLKELDHENYLLAQKLNKSAQGLQHNNKLQAELKFATKIIQQYQQNQLMQQSWKQKSQKDKQNYQIQKANYQKYKDQSQKQKEKYQKQKLNYQKQKQNYQKLLTKTRKQNELLLLQIKQLKRLIEEQKSKSTNVQLKLNQMINQKKNITDDDDKYFAQLEQQVQNSYKQIQRLQAINNQLMIKYRQISKKNQQLEADLHDYAQTFQKQSITFRTALQNLQKEKDMLGLDNKKISQQLRTIKLDIEQSRTAQSFYSCENNSSIQLRKTVSTDLDSHVRSSLSKISRKTISTLQKTNKTLKLKNVLQKLKYQLPVVCEIDATGYLKDQRTGCYFVDENQNYFELDQKQLANAVKLGLILL